MLTDEQIESLKTFDGDISNPQVVLEFLTGKTLSTLRQERACEMWPHHKDFSKAPYDYNTLVTFCDYFNEEPLDEVVKELNEVLEKYHVKLPRFPREIQTIPNDTKIRTVLMRKRFPDIDSFLTSDMLEDRLREFRKEQPIALFDYIKQKIREGALAGISEGAKRVKLNPE